MRRQSARFVRHAGPSRQWTELATGFVVSSTATTAVAVWGLQAPAAAAGLTALPPADVVIMRIRGNFQVTLSAASSTWVMGLTVQDQTWTPSAVFRTDADKRWLWLRTFTTNTEAVSWIPPGYMSSASDPTGWADARWTELDVAPKVKLESGQALYLVAYEETGASTMTITSVDMRMLWQQKRAA